MKNSVGCEDGKSSAPCSNNCMLSGINSLNYPSGLLVNAREYSNFNKTFKYSTSTFESTFHKSTKKNVTLDKTDEINNENCSKSTCKSRRCNNLENSQECHKQFDNIFKSCLDNKYSKEQRNEVQNLSLIVESGSRKYQKCEREFDHIFGIPYEDVYSKSRTCNDQHHEVIEIKEEDNREKVDEVQEVCRELFKDDTYMECQRHVLESLVPYSSKRKCASKAKEGENVSISSGEDDTYLDCKSDDTYLSCEPEDDNKILETLGSGKHRYVLQNIGQYQNRSYSTDVSRSGVRNANFGLSVSSVRCKQLREFERIGINNLVGQKIVLDRKPTTCGHNFGDKIRKESVISEDCLLQVSTPDLLKFDNVFNTFATHNQNNNINLQNHRSCKYEDVSDHGMQKWKYEMKDNKVRRRADVMKSNEREYAENLQKYVETERNLKNEIKDPVQVIEKKDPVVDIELKDPVQEKYVADPKNVQEIVDPRQVHELRLNEKKKTKNVASKEKDCVNSSSSPQNNLTETGTAVDVCPTKEEKFCCYNPKKKESISSEDCDITCHSASKKSLPFYECAKCKKFEILDIPPTPKGKYTSIRFTP